MLEAAPGMRALLQAALREPLLASGERSGGPLLGKREIETLLPHRDPFLLIDRVTFIDRSNATIACRYDLGRAARVLAGHFPGRPVWPGVLQVEAVGQAGLCLLRMLSAGEAPGSGARGVALTQILAAQFVRPIVPGSDVEIVTRAVSDGLFTILVGQCLQHDLICSAAALRGIEEEMDP